jgi:hypothetical protein
MINGKEKLEFLGGDIEIAKERFNGKDTYSIYVFDNGDWRGAELDFLNKEELIKIRDTINKVL